MASHCDALCGNLQFEYDEGDHDQHDYADKEGGIKDEMIWWRLVYRQNSRVANTSSNDL